MKKLLAAILLLALSWNATAAISYKQGAVSAENYGGTTSTASFGTLPSSGDSVLVAVAYRDTVAPSITDNQTGNTYTAVQTLLWSGQVSVSIFWCPSITSPTGTFTVTSTSAAMEWLTIADVSGLSASTDNGNAADSGGPISTYTITAAGANTNANDFVFAILSINSNSGTFGLVVPSTGYTQISNTDGNNYPVEVAYKIVSAIETSSADWSWTTASTNGAIAAIETFKAAGSASCSNTGYTQAGTYVVPTPSSTVVYRQDGNFGTVPCSGSGASNSYYQHGTFGVN